MSKSDCFSYGHFVVTCHRDKVRKQVYIPSVSVCPPGSHTNIKHMFTGDNSIIMGDFNAHHEIWYSNLGYDKIDTALAAQVGEYTFCIIPVIR